ncbi:unnamed protein product [Cochlearia groenlandica]
MFKTQARSKAIKAKTNEGRIIVAEAETDLIFSSSRDQRRLTVAPPSEKPDRDGETEIGDIHGLKATL